MLWSYLSLSIYRCTALASTFSNLHTRLLLHFTFRKQPTHALDATFLIFSVLYLFGSYFLKQRRTWCSMVFLRLQKTPCFRFWGLQGLLHLKPLLAGICCCKRPVFYNTLLFEPDNTLSYFKTLQLHRRHIFGCFWEVLAKKHSFESCRFRSLIRVMCCRLHLRWDQRGLNTWHQWLDLQHHVQWLSAFDPTRLEGDTGLGGCTVGAGKCGAGHLWVVAWSQQFVIFVI